jgi:hypothetical protein
VTLRPRVYPSVPIASGAGDATSVRRADIEVAGLEQAGPSYELRIFLNNPDADPETEPTEDTGYAGSIYIYGYGQSPPGGSGAEPRMPMTRSVMATRAVGAAAARGPTATVTLVPVAYDETSEPEVDLDPVEVSVLVDRG